jgi:acyl-coenzyme A synthetase/AMP-(fatty) acid ligase
MVAVQERGLRLEHPIHKVVPQDRGRSTGTGCLNWISYIVFKIHDVVLVDALPRTASNKIMRRALRDRYLQRCA